MPQKWNLQDIVPPDRKGRGRAREARQASDVRPPNTEETAEQSYDSSDESVGTIPVTDGRSRNIRRIVFTIVALIIFGAVAFGITLLLRGAEVTVYPKYKDSAVQATLTASRQPEIGELGYELLSLEEQGERRVSATGQEEASIRAEGTITVFNAFSTNPQRLIKNTRFESPDGLIYRIPDSIVVPGYTEDGDGNVVPGEITTKVFADGPGESYNIGEARFTIPGLEGTEQHGLMYAESDETGIAGGFEGTRFIIDEAELATARQELHMELRDRLLSRVENERPAGFAFFDSAITFVYESLPSTEAGESAATIKERAELHVPLFEQSSFASFIAENTIAGYEGAPVKIERPEELQFSYPEAEAVDISSAQTMSFNLNGAARIIWTFDHASLKADLAGVSKKALPTVLSGYPAIERAESVVRPFWQQSFPDNPDEIKIIEEIAVGN